jgi:hypothetical protein
MSAKKDKSDKIAGNKMKGGYEMKHGKVIVISIAALFLVMGTAVAGTVESDVDFDIDAEQSDAEFKESMKAMADFVRDVTFDEDDIKNIIAYWDDIQSFGEEEEETAYEDDEEETADYSELLAHPEYRSWAKSKGFDPDKWLKKFLRIQVMMMKVEMAAAASEGREQMKVQLAELEARRAQIGEEAYQQMKQAMEAGAAALDNVGDAYRDFPEPTSSEKALIERYREQIMDLQ